MRWRGWAAAGFALAAATYLGTCAFVLERATRARRDPLTGTPADLGLDFETIEFPSDTDQIRLCGWFLPARRERAIVMVHGLDTNRWWHTGNVPGLARRYVEHGYDVLTFDLRAHGESDGQRLGLGGHEQRDVLGAIAYLRKRGFAPGMIGIHAGSYGTAAAFAAAAGHTDVGAVVADSAFASARELINGEIHRRTGLPPLFAPGIAWLAQVFYRLDLDAISALRSVPRLAPTPILFIHGEADSRIPADHSQRLHAVAQSGLDELWIVPDVQHGRSFEVAPEQYAERVFRFFDRHLRRRDDDLVSAKAVRRIQPE